jgi:hypothetical protein
LSAITLDELLAEVDHSKLFLTNLFQTDTGAWRCNVRSSSLAFDFYEHPNPTAAVRGAIALAQHQQGVPLKQNKPRVSRAPDAPKITGQQLLALLKR